MKRKESTLKKISLITTEMGCLQYILVLVSCVCFVCQADEPQKTQKTYRDMFRHKHPLPGKFPYPIPPLPPFPGWDPHKIPVGKSPYPIPPLPPIPGWDPEHPDKWDPKKPDKLEKSPYPIPPLPPIPGWDPEHPDKWDPKKKPDKLEKSPYPIPPLPPIPGWDPEHPDKWDPKKPDKKHPDKLEKSPYPIPPLPPIPGWDPEHPDKWDPKKKPDKLEKSPYPIPPLPPIPGWDPEHPDKWDPKKPDKLENDAMPKKFPYPIPPLPPFPGWDPEHPDKWDPKKPDKKHPEPWRLEKKSPYPIPPLPPFPGWDPDKIQMAAVAKPPYPIPPLPPIPGWDPEHPDKWDPKKPDKKHPDKLEKFPFPMPPIPFIPSFPGWYPDTNPWDDTLYPPFPFPFPKPKPKDELTNRHTGKPTIRLTSDSPAINGSSISFTAKIEYPPCTKEDANGDLVWDQHCHDANGQVHSGYVFNETGPRNWLDDYGFGECKDLKRCDVFPDGKPFPQSNDWRRKGYVYVWHTMGQYYETCDGSSSTLSLNTSVMPLGSEVMEVMVYRKKERRKYTPLSTDSAVFFVTDKIPLNVNVSQKAAANLSDSVYVRGEEVVFNVQVHDPSDYLKTASCVNYIWDFHDGNQLVTHSRVATHAYSTLGRVNVKLTVEAAFRITCPPPSATPTPRPAPPRPPTAAPTPPPGTHAITAKMETTRAPPTTTTTTTPLPTTTLPTTTGFPTTEPLPDTVADVTPGPRPTAPPTLLRGRRSLKAVDDGEMECFRYLYGYFAGNITIVEPKHSTFFSNDPTNRILDVSAAKVTNTDISFLVKCLGRNPTSVCTIVSDAACRTVRSVVCNDVPPSPSCEVRLQRTFQEPGTYCVNITLVDPGSMALATTTVTIGKAQEDTPAASKSSVHTPEVVLTATVILAAVFAFIAFLVYKRYKVYRPVRRSLVEDAEIHVGGGGRMGRLRDTLFPTSEESQHLLTRSRPL